jgi:hypothetical protein
MLKQQTLDSLDVISKNPMISTVSFMMRSYADLPEISIQSQDDAPEDEVISLIESHLGEIKQANIKMDFDHSNCWGNSYQGRTSEAEIVLITSTTKEALPAQESPRELLQNDYNITDSDLEEVWTTEDILRQEG